MLVKKPKKHQNRQQNMFQFYLYSQQSKNFVNNLFVFYPNVITNIKLKGILKESKFYKFN